MPQARLLFFLFTFVDWTDSVKYRVFVVSGREEGEGTLVCPETKGLRRRSGGVKRGRETYTDNIR